MKTFLRFLALVIVLNLIRYFVPIFIEAPLVLEKLFAVMGNNPSYFNTELTTFDWVTSYFYNFMMWLVIVWVFHLLQPVLSGHIIVRSLKVFGVMLIFFASLSAIYMNHYSHPKEFYFYNILDAVIVFPIVAVANGLLYPWIMRRKATGQETAQAVP
jgi:hypothetical protein